MRQPVFFSLLVAAGLTLSFAALAHLAKGLRDVGRLSIA
jgi:hypothetical protein